jgi:23S rRNA (guanosine2251-2'-O)-methyltransferase
MDRVPFQATSGGALYQGIAQLPVAVLLDNIRSLYNVGSFFRTADATAIAKLYLGGITGKPPRKEISKTALGAEDTVPWEPAPDAIELIRTLRAREYEIAAIETSTHAAFGNELEGLQPELSALCDTYVRIPMLGAKHSLNVATAGGVVLYELLRKYRELQSRGTNGTDPPFRLALP